MAGALRLISNLGSPVGPRISDLKNLEIRNQKSGLQTAVFVASMCPDAKSEGKGLAPSWLAERALG